MTHYLLLTFLLDRSLKAPEAEKAFALLLPPAPAFFVYICQGREQQNYGKQEINKGEGTRFKVAGGGRNYLSILHI